MNRMYLDEIYKKIKGILKRTKAVISDFTESINCDKFAFGESEDDEVGAALELTGKKVSLSKFVT